MRACRVNPEEENKFAVLYRIPQNIKEGRLTNQPFVRMGVIDEVVYPNVAPGE